jgi:hypothetical protein
LVLTWREASKLQHQTRSKITLFEYFSTILVLFIHFECTQRTVELRRIILSFLKTGQEMIALNNKQQNKISAASTKQYREERLLGIILFIIIFVVSQFCGILDNDVNVCFRLSIEVYCWLHNRRGAKDRLYFFSDLLMVKGIIEKNCKQY